jgi:glycosyltransferase involved in cell wall biosynthesis
MKMQSKTNTDEQLYFPLVSIVTPSFNQGKFLEETIKSIIDQGYKNIEYIIIDGASRDNSVEIIKNYQTHLAYWESLPDKGQKDAINKGFNRAHGQIFAWLNSDDILYPHAVSEAVNFLVNNPDVGLVYGDANLINADGEKIGIFPAAQTNYEKLRRGYVHIPQQAAFFRAELWKKVGPLDVSFNFAMDYDLWVRLARESFIQYLPKLWAAFRLYGETKTINQDDQCWPEMLRVHYRDGGRFFSPIVAKYYIRKLIAPALRWRRNRMIKK